MELSSDEDIIMEILSGNRKFWVNMLLEGRQQHKEFHNLIQELKLRDGMLSNRKESNIHGVVCWRVKYSRSAPRRE